MAGILICSICDRPHFDFTPEEVAIARSWDFWVCGMSQLPHQDENFVRKTILVTNVDGTVRKNLFTKEIVPLDTEVGM